VGADGQFVFVCIESLGFGIYVRRLGYNFEALLGNVEFELSSYGGVGYIVYALELNFHYVVIYLPVMSTQYRNIYVTDQTKPPTRTRPHIAAIAPGTSSLLVFASLGIFIARRQAS
jgi:hypothetical protein